MKLKDVARLPGFSSGMLVEVNGPVLSTMLGRLCLNILIPTSLGRRIIKMNLEKSTEFT